LASNDIESQLLSHLMAHRDSHHQRVQSYLEAHYLPDRPTVLYGAGNIGKEVARRLKRIGHFPACFIDDTPSKYGKSIDGLTIHSLEDVMSIYGTDFNLIVTILNPNHSFLETKSRLALLGVCAMPFVALSWVYDGILNGLHANSTPLEITRQRKSIMSLMELWDDDRSRNEFILQLLFRLTLDYAYLSERQESCYFPDDVKIRFHDNTTFLDAGAYNGDTADLAVRELGAKLGRLIAFEPDPHNYHSLVEKIANLCKQDISILYQSAIGSDEGKLRFDASADMNSSLSDEGEIIVDVQPLSKFIVSDNMYLKFDIEGSEHSALSSCITSIRRFKPQIAVSVYHNSADLWEIPLLLKSTVPQYKLYLRNHGIDATDVICYALLDG